MLPNDSADAKALFADDDDAQTAGDHVTTSTSARAKVPGINIMKEELLDSYNG